LCFGNNKVDSRPPATFCELIMENLDDFTMKILIVCAILSTVINMITEEDKSIAWIDGFAILVAVTACTLVAAVNDF
jgi:hypothetical protein